MKIRNVYTQLRFSQIDINRLNGLIARSGFMVKFVPHAHHIRMIEIQLA